MHATGQARMHAWSMTSMHGSAITKAISSTSLLARYAHARPAGVFFAWQHQKGLAIGGMCKVCTHTERLGASALSAALTSKRKRATADSRHKKTPTSCGWGQAPWLLHWRPSPRKAPQQKAKQVSWLAAVVYSLRLPKVLYLSGQCRFRSAYSCGAAMALHHLPCSPRSPVRQLGFLRPISCNLDPNAISGVLSR